MKFITLDEVIAIHDLMLEIGGGEKLIHDFTLLHSAIERPRAQFGGKYLYSSIWLMAAAMMQSLVKNHPFNDANKRTAFFTTLRFLEKNHYSLKIVEKEVIEFMIHVDIQNLDIETIANWLENHSFVSK